MSKSDEKRVTQAAHAKGYRLEKVGKGPHHGRFGLVNVAEGSRMSSGVAGAEYTFSLEEAADWLAKKVK